ncbi:uridine phosphorylase [Ornithinibacillus sp. L9]|uniref:Uridine phosphorylase n=1 Tax=Ornithinibacillus caprae TaxID=2678566 RepID=A0A6N8FLN7_9BACI|nr:uridine phosphorylase [Ornithinibacillus caprae]MUK88897.1 uridine phosphorylase [Ornithinibacillus caprae]
MKLYGDYTKEDWMKNLGMKEAYIPGTFIIHGEYEHEENMETWKKLLTKEQWHPTWNLVVGEHNNQQIGFANVFGGPSASMVAHRFALMGTENLIQTGYYGGLSLDIEYGDILIVTGAYMEDGVSQWYAPGETMVYANSELVCAAIDYCEEKGYRYVTGSVFSTSAMLMETAELVKSWSQDGHIGVDMETATTFAIARKFNRKSIGLLNLSDHIIEGDTFYSRAKHIDDVMDETDRRIREISLYLAEKF